MPTIAPPLEVGDQLPAFELPATGGTRISLDKLVGKPLVIFFYLQDGAAGCTAQVCAFRDLENDFRKLGVQVLGVGIEPIESHEKFASENALPFPLLSANGSDVLARYGVLETLALTNQSGIAARRITYLIDPSFRIFKTYLDVSSASHAAEVLEDASRMLLREEPRMIVQHAPVLLIPNVLPPEVCQRCIELWATENEDSGFMREIEGKTVGVTDYNHKIRRDHFVQKGPDEEMIMRYISSRVVGRIRMAFNYSVTRKEDFRVACYDASRGGYFRPHRDNTTGSTAHRRFAMSLLLNDDYEAGHLRFPEYGPHLYRPDAGGAVIFSCSLLHEATDVTAGRRFVLLSFLYGDAEAKAREEYNRRTGGSYRA